MPDQKTNTANSHKRMIGPRKPRTFIGQKFGKLTVTSAMYRADSIYFVSCVCDCGKSKTVRVGNLKSGGSRSCGCQSGPGQHGEFSSYLPEYKSWEAMKRRCYDSKHDNYRRYGGRGITVCERWLNSFDAFYRDMGPRPSKTHSLDRLNSDDNYKPENCRWAGAETQNNNTRRNVYIAFRGETLTASQWSKRMGLTRSRVSDRLAAGWSVERAILTPLHHR